MAKLTLAPKVVPGNKQTVTGAAVQTDDDLLTLHGVTLTYREWVRRGVIRVTGSAGNNRDIHVLANPEIAT